MTNKHFHSERLRRWRTYQHDIKPSFIETLDTIERDGWQVWAIASPHPDSLDFSYTVGLHDIFGLPELITVGLPAKVGAIALNEAVRLMRAGEILTKGRIQGLLGGKIEVEFHEISSRWLQRAMLRTHWYYEATDVPALQLVYPDLDNLFQWEEGFNSFFAQPMLAPGYPEQDLEQEFWDEQDFAFDKSAWKFSDPPSKKVMTSVSIEAKLEHVTYVAHYSDGEWMFLGDKGLESSASVSRLRRLIATDRSLEALADLPRGWTSTREAVGSHWEHHEDADENGQS